MDVTLLQISYAKFTVTSLCHPSVAGGYHWLPVQPSHSSLLPANFGQDRHLLHDGTLCSACDYRLACESRPCGFLPGFLEHLSGRYSSGPGHRGRSCFGYPCELSAGAAAGSAALRTSSNFTANQHELGGSLPAALLRGSRRPPGHENGHESSDYSLLMSTVWAALR